MISRTDVSLQTPLTPATVDLADVQERIIVGVNQFTMKEAPISVLKIGKTMERDQVAGGGYRPPAELATYLDQHYRYAGRVVYADFYQREER